MKTCLVTLALSMPAFAASPVQVDGFTYVRTVGGIDEYKLDSNDLRVLMLPQPDVPTTTFMVTYHVGSRNEVTGTTGATHLLEHLMFKGTASHHRGNGTSYDQVLERVGSLTNATTWLDRTNYFSTVPSNALPLLIEMEADRMRNLSLHEEDRRPEMTVVRNEFELGENNPMDALSKEIWATAFQAHPYHHDTIGWRSDIENVPIEKLREFYDTFYWPNNATATVIGGFDAKATLEVIKQHYGAIPKSPHPFPKLYTEEPKQTGQRRVQMKRSGELGLVTIAHKIPKATDADWPAIEVFSTILTHGDTSRCFRALTDNNLTIEVDGWAAFTHDPSLHVLTAELAADSKHDVVERELVKQIELIQTKGVTDDEVKTAIAGFLAHRAFSRDGSFQLANEINDSIAVGDWTLYVTLEDKLKAVTAADVQRVAKQYFVEDQSTVGWFIPTDEGGHTTEASSKQDHFEPKEVVPPAPLKQPLAPSPKTDFARRIQRTSIHGADVLVCPSAAKDIVCVRISLPVGEGRDSNRALASLTFDMTERGTTKHDKFAIAEQLESAGVDVQSKVNTDSVEMTVKCLSHDLEMAMGLIVEQWRTPSFPKDEFTKAKKDYLSGLQHLLEETDEQAAIAFSHAVRAEGDPMRRATVDELTKGARKATLEDVKKFYAQHYGPQDLRIVVVGDVDAKAVNTMLTSLLAGWKTQPGTLAKAPPMNFASADVKVPMADKSSVSVMIGQPSNVRATEANWLPLNVANDALGNGFTSRLIGNVRDREGLTYHIGSRVADDGERPGLWIVNASFAPTMLDKGIASTMREITRWHDEGITAEELEFRKTANAGEFIVHLETTGGLAEQIMQTARRGFEMKWIDEYPAQLAALTLEQVNAAIKAQIDPSKLITVKAGVAK